MQEGLAEKLPAGEVPRRIREAPFVQIPLGVTEDRLVGTVDIEASMKVRDWHILFAVYQFAARRGASNVGRLVGTVDTKASKKVRN